MSNTVNPASQKVQDFITLGPNVNFIDNSSTYFTAKNEILLANNTTIDGVSAFIAQAEDCLNQPIEFYQQIEEIHVNSNCYFRILLSACFGSGQYAFYFDDELSTDKYKDYSLESAGSTITVKVIDLITGVVVVKVIVLPNKPIYLEKITMTIPNVFTPNGDAINDIFRIIDNNKSQFAYNATWFYLQIWNRWGNDILVQERVLDASNFYGFSDDAIYWNGRNNNDPDGNILESGTYYYLFKIGNCNPNESKAISGTITLIKNNYKEEVGIDEKIYSNINFQSEIYPNPTANNVTLKLFNVNTITEMTITNILGKEQNIDCKLVENNNGVQEYSIDCSLLNNGIYFCKINKNGITETIKFSIIK